MVFIQWTRSGSSLSGSIQQTTLNTIAGSGANSSQASFTGVVSGNGLTLQLNSDLDGTSSLVGQLSGDGFTLNYPGSQTGSILQIAFAPGQVSDYNADVSNLEQSPYGSPCMLYVTGNNVQVTVKGPDAASVCQQFVQNAESGTAWTTNAQTITDTISQVCSLVNGQDSVIVTDSGGQSLGQQACSYFTNAGWTGAGTE